MAGGIAHDFNNLLTGILGYCDLALQEMPQNSTARDHVAEAVRGARQAAELTKQMLAYSGKGKFVVESVSLSNLVEDMARLLQISISKKCALKYDFPPDLPAIEADATQVRQIVMNLVINASEAIGDRGGLIAISTGVRHCDRAFFDGTLDDRALPEGLYAYLEVADTGCGMNGETRAKIFDPFFTTKFTGRGLGLSAVLGIVRGHGGTMTCDSEPGKGTTFVALFPVTDRPPAAAAADAPAAESWRGSGTVLVVDDEDTVRAVCARMLDSLGFATVLAKDGADAVEKYRRGYFTAVLMDLTMPHMDGEEAFRQLRLLNPSVRVLLMSGFNEQEAINRFTGKGLAGFLQKPFKPHALGAKLRQTIEGGGKA